MAELLSFPGDESFRETKQMMASLLRATFVSGVCVGLMACSQPASQPMASASTPQTSAASGARSAVAPGAQTARVCTTRGRPANAGFSDPWAITVSNEGGNCSHTREVGRSNNQTYQIAREPQHGQLSQTPQGPKTMITYTPARGYTGTDSFALKSRDRNIEMPYMINVIP